MERFVPNTNMLEIAKTIARLKLDEIEGWAQQNKIPLLGRLPFSTQIAQSIENAQIPGESSELRAMMLPLWESIIEQLAVV